jgi:hypothetical protein
MGRLLLSPLKICGYDKGVHFVREIIYNHLVARKRAFPRLAIETSAMIDERRARLSDF